MGSLRQCACVQILQDVEDDDNEQFVVAINTTSPNINITRNTSAVTIVDDDRKKTSNGCSLVPRPPPFLPSVSGLPLPCIIVNANGR